MGAKVMAVFFNLYNFGHIEASIPVRNYTPPGLWALVLFFVSNNLLVKILNIK